MFLNAAQWSSTQTSVYKIQNSLKDIFTGVMKTCIVSYVIITASGILSGAAVTLKLITQTNQQREP